MKELVRHIAASSGPRVAIGAFEKEVEVWDISASVRVGTFSTVLDFGGRRLCLDHEGARCFAGAYHRYGVVGYAADGRMLWSRPDIKRVQYISYSRRGLFIGAADGPALLVDGGDGKTMEKLRGVRQIFECGTGAARLLDRTRPVVEYQSGGSFELTRTSFAILDAAFGPSTICVSEASGPTRCLDLGNGQEIWRYQPPHGEHVVALAYCSSAGKFVGIAREYERTSDYKLLELGTGENVRLVAALGRPAAVEFCLSGAAVLLADGHLVEAMTGQLLRIVPFATGAG